MSDVTISTRFGPVVVKVSDNGNVLVDGTWFQHDGNRFSHWKHGVFVGQPIRTMSGSAVLFSYNGHRYQAASAVAAFAKLALSELDMR